ncbi:hypothetical protein FHY25_001741 [Xanthomonas arboricola]|nr:hypothetical protein [Xanthomonas campestris]MCW2007160.1 hypothetical protein [Xanthomonas campestris]
MKDQRISRTVAVAARVAAGRWHTDRTRNA